MKVLFLDIDGVLNSLDNVYSRIYLWKHSNKNKSRDEYGDIFDERCVRWLQYIIEKTDCKIVVSSTWRKGGLKYIHNLWKFRNLPGEVIDITPSVVDNNLISLYGEEADRGYEIQQWIEDNSPERYCIVDDDNDMLSCQIFVKTDSAFGLTRKDAMKIIRILK